MVMFSWIVLSFAGLLLAGSGLCWALFIGMDDSRWRELGVKVFQIAKVVLLFYVNGMIYGHLISGLRGA